MLDTKPLLFRSGHQFPEIKRTALSTLQVNLGYRCNLSCTHCHVNAGPKRTESMSWEGVQQVLQVLRQRSFKTLDLTGGAPEMHPQFRYLVEQASQLGVEVIDRCNLTILLEPEYEEMAAFLAQQRVRIVASLPCYSEKNVDAQRGKGVFHESIEGLRQLNKLGFGIEGTGLMLDLVYNPGGAFLPPPQQTLEQDYKEHLLTEFGVSFNHLLTLTNMPISRFGSMLLSKGMYDDYMGLLHNNYKADNLNGLMCKTTISVDWECNLYDCDFNQMLQLPLTERGRRAKLSDLLATDFSDNTIAVADHCFGCTAGQGSSCGGALG